MTFQVNTTYTTRTPADYVWTLTVVARSARFITIQAKDGTTSKVGVIARPGENERAFPLGKFSMAPLIDAGRVA